MTGDGSVNQLVAVAQFHNRTIGVANDIHCAIDDGIEDRIEVVPCRSDDVLHVDHRPMALGIAAQDAFGVSLVG